MAGTGKISTKATGKAKKAAIKATRESKQTRRDDDAERPTRPEEAR